MNNLSPLFLLVGGLTFALGFLAGAALFAKLAQRRERTRVTERRALNEAWRYLHRHFGVERPVWMAHLVDRERQQRRSRRVRHRRWFNRRVSR